MMMCRRIFEGVSERQQLGGLCQVTLQYIELYNEELQDLLPLHVVCDSVANSSGGSSGRSIAIRESPTGEIFIEGAREVSIRGAAHMLEIVALGNASR